MPPVPTSPPLALPVWSPKTDHVTPPPPRHPPANPTPQNAAPARIAALDLIRGVAVLGILAVNIAGFAGPIDTTDSPALAPMAGAGHTTFAAEASFAAVFLVFEGKMRALFSLLFGASMLLFIERAEARGANGEALQLRRLVWLGVFGYCHYVLLWWGDILFDYAVCGILALMLRRLSPRTLAIVGLAGFGAWHLWGAIDTLPTLLAEEHIARGTASAAEHAAVARDLAATHLRIAHDLAQAHLGFAANAAAKWRTAAGWPLVVTLYTIGETLPLMLLGMALHTTGFFRGEWPRRRVMALAGGGLALGLAWALAVLVWTWPRHFPPLSMPYILSYWAGPEHLAGALAYAALLVLAAPRLLASQLGAHLAATGRMAFSNYLVTSVVMCAIFYGWGLNLEGRVSAAAQLALVVAGWALMLGWSKPWLGHFRQGPLEWAWRSLTEWQVIPLRKG